MELHGWAPVKLADAYCVAALGYSTPLTRVNAGVAHRGMAGRLIR